MPPSPDENENLDHLLAMARVLLSEVLEEGLEHIAPAQSLEATPPDQNAEAISPGLKTAPIPPDRPQTYAAPTEVPPEQVQEASRPGTIAPQPQQEECPRCGESRCRQSLILGHGNPNAELMFVGEDLGQAEDIQGRPFLGEAGELLLQMIEKGIHTPQEDVYICNIRRCRPNLQEPQTPPSQVGPERVNTSRPLLDAQIDTVRPKVIISLGQPAAELMLNREVNLSEIRGTWHEYQGVPLIPTLHPAFVLQEYTHENRKAVWQDLKSAIERI